MGINQGTVVGRADLAASNDNTNHLTMGEPNLKYPLEVEATLKSIEVYREQACEQLTVIVYSPET